MSFGLDLLLRVPALLLILDESRLAAQHGLDLAGFCRHRVPAERSRCYGSALPTRREIPDSWTLRFAAGVPHHDTGFIRCDPPALLRVSGRRPSFDFLCKARAAVRKRTLRPLACAGNLQAPSRGGMMRWNLGDVASPGYKIPDVPCSCCCRQAADRLCSQTQLPSSLASVAAGTE